MRLWAVAKPGIIFGNIVTICGGFFLGSPYKLNIGLLLITLAGMAFVIAAGCLLNNVIDQDIDKLMTRTQKRALVTGEVSSKSALIAAGVAAPIGLGILYLGTNWLTLLVAAIGLVFYVLVYSLWTKRQSVYGTIIGGVAGAVPPVAGYTAATGNFDLGAIILFMILFLWQVPHFYAIAIYRLEDYKAAGIPLMPITKGIFYTKVYMLLYVVGFTLAAVMPTITGYIGQAYGYVALLAGIIWIIFSLQGFFMDNEHIWARRMFILSIFNITLLSMMMLVKA